MKIEHRIDKQTLAADAAAHIVALARASIAARGRFEIALSGGSTPWMMLDALVPMVDPDAWSAWRVFQVDERAAAVGDADRNWTHITTHLIEPAGLSPAQCHSMPVLHADRDSAAASYAAEIPGAFDLVQLGIGDDGHTASLVPGDSILAVDDCDVAWTGEDYRGYSRMSLTFRPIRAAREVVWLVAGADKREVLERVIDGDESLPAARVGRGLVFAAV